MVENKKEVQKVGIVGLGLMGGSLAKAIHHYGSAAIFGYDKNKDVLAAAKKEDVIQGELTSEILKTLDVLVLALYPHDIVAYMQEHIDHLKPGCIVTDLCGIKTYVCSELGPLCCQHHMHYIGGHPMAGREFSGYQFATETLFVGGSMILVPTESTDEVSLNTLKEFLLPLGFSKIVETTPQNHDRMIAYTSQLAHVVSSAYIKSPEATQHHGYSAGSYRDMTRVARLNETMWTELFLKNRGPLLEEINHMIDHLTEYRDALQQENETELKQLLKQGRERKEKIDQNES